MRIAQIAPVWFAVPPTGYGGIELIVALLADGLAEQGHDVTLFASGGSQTKATLVSPLDEPPDPQLLGSVWYDAFHCAAAYLHSDEFDVIHDHSGIIGPAIGAVRGAPPVVHTLHGPWTDQARQYYDLLHRRVNLVAISEAQRNDNPGIQYAATVYNGIELDSYEYRAGKDDYLVYIGRANPDKGPERAIEIARAVDRPLTMILKRNEPPERTYYDEVIEPLLGSDVTVVANVSHAEKVELLGRAKAMLFPIQWMEPFGLVMTEAMACGTPVVTTNWGAAPELVDDGVTGFRRDTDEALIEALGHIDDLSPADCRERVERLFSAEAMVKGYEQVFAEVAG
jgi:glycosyltransferase involved in cell wall biosynthesis